MIDPEAFSPWIACFASRMIAWERSSLYALFAICHPVTSLLNKILTFIFVMLIHGYEHILRRYNTDVL
jgi:hypothetical protein